MVNLVTSVNFFLLPSGPESKVLLETIRLFTLFNQPQDVKQKQRADQRDHNGS